VLAAQRRAAAPLRLARHGLPRLVAALYVHEALTRSSPFTCKYVLSGHSCMHVTQHAGEGADLQGQASAHDSTLTHYGILSAH